MTRRLFTLLFLLITAPAFAQTKITDLGLTQEEINIWNARRVSGPYRVNGDVQTNSPGDWTRINNNANSFRAGSATAERWTGQPGGSCWSASSPSPALPGRNLGERLRDTAFRYLLQGDANDLAHALNGLLDQAAQAGTNWADSSRWNITDPCLDGDAHSWQIAMWMSKLVLAYDYIRHAISAGNRTTLDTWFSNAAVLFDANAHDTAIVRFPNRDSDNYSVQDYTSCIGPILTHFGGFTHCDFHEGWNNRMAQFVRVSGLVGIITNNSSLKTRAKRWVKERIRFNVFSDNTDGEFHRSVLDPPGTGWDYTGLAIGTMISIADAFARTGDMELYNYSTSLGDNVGLTPAGGPKTLRGIVTLYINYMDHTVVRYGTSNPANNGNSNYIIDSVDELTGENRINDTFFAQPNILWQDASIKAKYLRQTGGSPAYPSSVAPSGWCVYCGEWGIYPGALFMFGQMEGLVNPYGTEPPANPEELIGHWKFDENTGTTANDETDNNNDGVLTNGAGWTTGFSNSAVSFDGVNDYVKIATTDFDVNHGTVALWVKPAACSATETLLFGHSTDPPFANRIQVYINDSSCNLALGFGDSHEKNITIHALATDTWFRVVLVWNQGVWAVYVNGTIRASGTYTGFSALHTHAHIGGIGVDSSPSSWNGAIDEVKIWNYPLTSVEVLADYVSYQSLAPPVNVKISAAKTLKVGAGKTLKVGLQ